MQLSLIFTEILQSGLLFLAKSLTNKSLLSWWRHIGYNRMYSDQVRYFFLRVGNLPVGSNVSSPRLLCILNLKVWRSLPTAIGEFQTSASSWDLYANIPAWCRTRLEDNLEDIAFGSHVLLGAILLRLSCLQRKRRGRKYNNIIC